MMRKRERLEPDDVPSQPAVGGRRPNGRFAPGNQLSQGNVIARKAARCRAKLFDAVTLTDFDAVVKRVVKEARNGQHWACKLLFAYLLGDPTAPDLTARLDEIRQALGNQGQRL
jgi:hypothetical protein